MCKVLSILITVYGFHQVTSEDIVDINMILHADDVCGFKTGCETIFRQHKKEGWSNISTGYWNRISFNSVKILFLTKVAFPQHNLNDNLRVCQNIHLL